MAIAEAVFETERLYARPWTLADAPAAFEMYGDPEVQKGLNREPVKDLDEQRRQLQSVLATNEVLGGRFGYWASVLKETDEVVGAVILKPLPNSELVEVGWHLARTRWGKGYATEAGRGALRYGFEVMELDRVYAIALPWNVKSRAVMERLGMRFLELTREYHDLELVLYEWSADPAKAGRWQARPSSAPDTSATEEVNEKLKYGDR
jgi:RimJ/RimL family protein N-acetyltransferase